MTEPARFALDGGLDRAAVAARALPLLDLTDLSDDCTEAAIDALAVRGVTAFGTVAALCVWPRFVAQAKANVAGTGIRIATVVNFPHGGEDARATAAETRAALAAGADEIDVVLPYRALMAGRVTEAARVLTEVRAAVNSPARLKVILETGVLATPELIRQAARLALGCGADFLKTSTGKTPVSATPEAAVIILEAIASLSRPVGLKASGGIRTVEDAATYLALADERMGPKWVSPATFRFGASGLLADLVMALEGGGPRPAAFSSY